MSFTLKILVNGEIVAQASDNTLDWPYEMSLDYTLQAPDRNQPPEQCPCQKTQTGDPIDTRTGQSWTTATDLVVLGHGPALAWERAYVTRNTALISNTIAPLGVGWQHGYGDRVFTDPAEPNVVSILTPKGNRFRYLDQGDGTFESFPGIFNTLVQANGVYTQTFRSHEQRVFDAATGHLTDIYDAEGGHLHLTYTNGKLTQIADTDASHRRIDLAYAGDRITSIEDGIGRVVAYTYITATNDLHQVFDVAGRPITYLYQNHLLTGIDNALGQPIERTAYDVYSPAGKAISQTLLDGRQLHLAYTDTTTVVTTTTPAGDEEVETFVFGPQSTLTKRYLNGVLVQDEGTDASFAPATRTDEHGNVSHTTYNANGQPLIIENALGERTTYAYDDQSNPITVTDTLGRQTVYAYNERNHVVRETRGITTSAPLGRTTIYTYSATLSDLLIGEQTPDGQITLRGYSTTSLPVTMTVLPGDGSSTTTQWDYDTFGQVITTTVDVGESDPVITTFGYDAWGRVITTTLNVGTPLERQDVTIFNADDTIQQTIQHFVDGDFDPERSGEDITTTYGYDGLGRQIWVRDVLGHYTVTHYTLAGQVAWTVQNLAPMALDGVGQPILPSLAPAYDPAQPDQNVATFTGYDGFGRTTHVTQTGYLTGTFDLADLRWTEAMTRVTWTQYDTLGRPITVTENYRPDLPLDGSLPDVNVQTITRYDRAGNVTWSRDPLGRWTHTAYDALSRPVTVTLNFEDGIPSSVNPAHSGWAEPHDTDIITVNRYSPDGRLTKTITNWVNGTFTVSEPITDVVTRYDYNPLGQLITSTLAYDPATIGTRTDTNRTHVSAYDPLTRRFVGQQDSLGRWNHTIYDDQGRMSTRILNCRTAQGIPAAHSCAPFDPAIPDQNVPITMRYDAWGHLTETETALGTVAKTVYTPQGQIGAMIQNYVPNQPTTPVTNVTTLYAYDVFGRTVAVTDALDVTTTSYDARGGVAIVTTAAGTITTTANALGQTTITTDTHQGVTRSGYDGHGTLRWSQRPDGAVTVYGVDGLGRSISTIQGYQDGTAQATDAADQDVISRVALDAAGRTTAQIAPGGRRMAFTYDDRDQLRWVHDNAPTGACDSPPCSVTTEYQYNRAGQRIAIVDGNDHIRRFTYTVTGEQASATDAVSRTTTWDYDRMGRKTVQHDPRGSAFDVTYTYDGLDRITETLSLALAAPIQIQYDALGRRQQMTDASGTTSYQYDPLGRVIAVEDGDNATVGYRYDERNQRIGLDYPNGTSLDYTYTADGQLETVNQGTTERARYGYDSADRLASLTRSNGVATVYTYDQLDRPIRQTTSMSTTMLSDLQYQLDARGQRAVVTETLPLLAEASTLQSMEGLPSLAAAAVSQDDGAASLMRSSATPLEHENYLTPAADGQAMLAATSIYTATLGDAGVDLTVRGAGSTAADRRLAVRMQQLKRGTTTIPLVAAQPARDAQNPNMVVLRRATGIREEQIAYRDGVKQNIVLDQPPVGSGDLEVRYHLTTQLEAQITADQGLRFFRKGPGNTRQLAPLAMSPVVVYDAIGTRMTARVSFQGARLTAHIPEDFLTSAQYPITIDPLIGLPSALSTGTSSAQYPVVAQAATGNFMTVFADTRDGISRIYAQFFSVNGEMLGGSGVLSTAGGRAPAISTPLTSTGKVLTAWEHPGATSSDISFQVRWLYSQGSTTAIITTSHTEVAPRITTNPTAQEYLVVWSDLTDGGVYARRVLASGVLTGSVNTVFAPGTWDLGTAVTFNPMQGEYLVLATTSTGVVGQRLTAQGATIGSAQSLVVTSTVPQSVQVAPATTGSYLIAWQDGNTIFGQRLTSTAAITGSDFTIADGGTDSLALGQLIWSRSQSHFVVSWSAPLLHQIGLQRITTSGTLLGSAWTVTTATSITPYHVALAEESGWQRYALAWDAPTFDGTAVYGMTIATGTGQTMAGPVMLAAPASTVTVPSVTYNAINDRFVTIWRDQRGSITPTLRLQTTTGSGTLIGANSTLTTMGDDPPGSFVSMGHPSSGHVLVVWDTLLTSGQQTIVGTRIGPTGQITPTLRFAISAPGGQRRNPRITYNATDDEYLVAWESRPSNGSYVVEARRLAADGTPLGSVLTISTAGGVAVNVIYHPVNQEYLVTWNTPQLQGQRVSRTGSLVGSVVLLLSPAAKPGGAALGVVPSTTTYQVVYIDYNRANTGQFATYGQQISASLGAVGSEVTISPPQPNHWHQRQSIVAQPEQNHYLVVWNDNYAVYGRRLTAQGEVLGNIITLADNAYVKTDPAAAARTGTNEIYLAWRQSTVGWDSTVVMGQRYASPQASFTATAVAPVGTMVFSDTSTSPLAITSWLWTFGDGITSTLQNPTHVYSPTGLYTVTLTITTGTEWDLGTQVITVPSTLPIPLQTTVTTYTYDGLSRLTEAERSGGEVYTYTYDLVGNRLSAWEDGVGRSWSYDAADQVQGWTYDAAGNLTNDGSQQYTYDALGRLTHTVTGGITTTYGYNGDGVLLAQTVDGLTTQFVQDTQAPLSYILQWDDGTTATTELYGLSRVATVTGGQRAWYLQDALGSTRSVVDDAGIPLTVPQYDPWGATTDAPAFGFTGEWQNPTTGLTYLRARWYQPAQGTLLGRDPFEGITEQPYSMHPYQYGYDDPINRTDPSGLNPQERPSEGCCGPDDSILLKAFDIVTVNRSGHGWNKERTHVLADTLLKQNRLLNGAVEWKLKHIRQQDAKHRYIYFEWHDDVNVNFNFGLFAHDPTDGLHHYFLVTDNVIEGNLAEQIPIPTLGNDGLAWTVAHEVGHALDLNTNFSSQLTATALAKELACPEDQEHWGPTWYINIANGKAANILRGPLGEDFSDSVALYTLGNQNKFFQYRKADKPGTLFQDGRPGIPWRMNFIRSHFGQN